MGLQHSLISRQVVFPGRALRRVSACKEEIRKSNDKYIQQGLAQQYLVGRAGTEYSRGGRMDSPYQRDQHRMSRNASQTRKSKDVDKLWILV